MGKALRDEAVVRLPRISNNACHGGLRLAQGVKSFHHFHQFFASQSTTRSDDFEFTSMPPLYVFMNTREEISCNTRDRQPAL